MNLKSEVFLSVVAYSLCSGTLVLLNKLTLHHLPYPSLVVSFQLLAALIFIYGAKHTGRLQVDALEWQYVLPYLFYILLFSVGVFCNMKSLSMSNVETVIVFRALSPCIVAFLDVLFLGREYPSLQSWTGLSLIALGAYGYASFDAQFQTQGLAAYAWPGLYLFIISLEMAYGKRIIQSVNLKTLSGPVLYTNLLGLPPMLMFAAMGHEYRSFVYDHMVEQKPVGGVAVLLLLLGCAAGTGIGYAGWWCRGNVSATSFTLIGVINKCLTILLNVMIWDQHAPPKGILSLALCLVGGSIYRQSPLRNNTLKTSSSVAVDDGDDKNGRDDSDNVATDAEDINEQVELLEAEKGMKRRS
jgi:GDP-mannose transporter